MIKFGLKLIFQFFIAALLSLPAFAKDDPPVKANVTLFPMGSFELTSVRIFGKGTKSKKTGMYTAKELKVPVSMLKTGMSLRDKHLKEKIDFKKHKFIFAKNIKAKGNVGQALMTIRGVTKPVKFKFKDLGNNKAQAQFSLNLKDFGISGINYQGVGVKDNIEVFATVPYDEI